MVMRNLKTYANILEKYFNNLGNRNRAVKLKLKRRSLYSFIGRVKTVVQCTHGKPPILRSLFTNNLIRLQLIQNWLHR